MLHLVEAIAEKTRLQKIVAKQLKTELNSIGVKAIGYPSGTAHLKTFTNGDGRLWAAFNNLIDVKTPRYWNGFGIYSQSDQVQEISVEINIQTKKNTAKVAGFFARDPDSGDTFLMHSGKIGGGRPGIGKRSFLSWSTAPLYEVLDSEHRKRLGIAVARVGERKISENIWTFVQSVNRFKEVVISGALSDDVLKKQKNDFEKYHAEFSGKKQGKRKASFSYETRHGDVVEALRDECEASKAAGNRVLNTRLIDLCVHNGQGVVEIYEVKTQADRQILYTAIGQLMTHSSLDRHPPERFLLIPELGKVPRDIAETLKKLGISIRLFRLSGKKGKSGVTLL
jgi:hypothetical protein